MAFLVNLFYNYRLLSNLQGRTLNLAVVLDIRLVFIKGFCKISYVIVAIQEVEIVGICGVSNGLKRG